MVLGISPDKVPALAKFRAKYELNFDLLSDTDHAVAEAFGVWKEKKNYGKVYMGIERSAFLIGADGTGAQGLVQDQPEGHAGQAARGAAAS